jgi:hypothetical protein
MVDMHSEAKVTGQKKATEMESIGKERKAKKILTGRRYLWSTSVLERVLLCQLPLIFVGQRPLTTNCCRKATNHEQAQLQLQLQWQWNSR